MKPAKIAVYISQDENNPEYYNIWTEDRALDIKSWFVLGGIDISKYEINEEKEGGTTGESKLLETIVELKKSGALDSTILELINKFKKG